MGVALDSFIEITGSVLLFCLVFGMSATVDVSALRAQLQNVKAIGTGVFLQFGILPLAGFAAVRAFRLNHAEGLTLLVVTSSPGGSYSNWWCSMFNADLALSVTMTAISTCLSTVMLPLNLIVYARWSYNDDIVSSLDWKSLVIALVIVILAIALGITASAYFKSHAFNLNANRLGNFAGIALVVFSAVMSNSDADVRIWDREWRFYLGVSTPYLIGLTVANVLTSVLRLRKPERVTTSIECCYQNVGIATSVALSMFDGENQAKAVAVPFFYGLVEAVFTLMYCMMVWKAGWTKAPSNVSVWKMLSTSYEILNMEEDMDQADGYVRHQEGGMPLDASAVSQGKNATEPSKASMLAQHI